MGDPSTRALDQVCDRIARLNTVMLAEAALANDRAAREDGATLFSESEQGFLQRLVETAEQSAPSQNECDQLLQLFGRVAESPYVPFPGKPRLKQMLDLAEAASSEAQDGAHAPTQMPVRHRTRPSPGDDHRTRASATGLPGSESAATPQVPADEDPRLPPYRRRSRPILGKRKPPRTDAD